MSAFLAGVHTLAYCVVDYKGHRLVAQSVLPGLLYSNKTAELMYGSPDLGETIKWDKDFHEKVRMRAHAACAFAARTDIFAKVLVYWSLCR